MARASLSTLLGNVEDPPAPKGAEPRDDAGSRESGHEASPPVRAPRAVRRRPKPAVDEEPLYLRLVRKETRLREEQYEALTSHARRLSRARRGRGVRITENTLIRVAIDLLLERVADASGVDEREIRESLR